MTLGQPRELQDHEVFSRRFFVATGKTLRPMASIATELNSTCGGSFFGTWRPKFYVSNLCNFSVNHLFNCYSIRFSVEPSACASPRAVSTLHSRIATQRRSVDFVSNKAIVTDPSSANAVTAWLKMMTSIEPTDFRGFNKLMHVFIPYTLVSVCPTRAHAPGTHSQAPGTWALPCDRGIARSHQTTIPLTVAKRSTSAPQVASHTKNTNRKAEASLSVMGIFVSAYWGISCVQYRRRGPRVQSKSSVQMDGLPTKWSGTCWPMWPTRCGLKTRRHASPKRRSAQCAQPNAISAASAIGPVMPSPRSSPRSCAGMQCGISG